MKLGLARQMTLSKYWFTGLPISLVSSLRDPCEGALFYLDVFLFCFVFVGGNSCDSGFRVSSHCAASAVVYAPRHARMQIAL